MVRKYSCQTSLDNRIQERVNGTAENRSLTLWDCTPLNDTKYD